MRSFPRPARRRLVALVALATTLTLVGCSQPKQTTAPSPTPVVVTPTPTRPSVVLTSSVTDGSTVPVDTQVQVTAAGGSVTGVTMSYDDPKTGTTTVQGTLAPDGSSWTANSLLEPGATYLLTMTGVSVDGDEVTTRTSFFTEKLSLKNQIFPSILMDGQTVGTAMPVMVVFDVPVTDRAAIERHLSVTTVPEQRGSWHWYSSTEVHWRPVEFWKPGTKVSVHVDINGVNAGNGVYGQMSVKGGFTVADRSLVMKADLTTHTMVVTQDGKVTARIPFTGGKPGFETRSGTKVIIEKFRKLRMDAATLGIEKDDPEYWNIPDVQWAMRETWSGEFIHSAPWSVASQGNENVSHGCIGVSLEWGAWLFARVIPGDPVIVTGSTRTLEPGNGITDWNAPFETYAQGSALD